MKKSLYRLGEYKIVEYDDGGLSWESHFGLAAQREGRCYLRGNIIFIDSWLNEEAGFLKNEFLINLRRLPKWDKTEYYSAHSDFYACKTGRKISPKEMPQKHLKRSLTHSAQHPKGEAISYRLNRHEIVCRQEGQLIWKTSSGSNHIQCGKCLIMEDILFLGPCEKEQICTKKEFLTHLKSLPVWEHTRSFCRSLGLHYCETGKPLVLEEDAERPQAAAPAIKMERFKQRQYDLKDSLYKELSGTVSRLRSYKNVVSDVTSKHLLPCLSSFWKLAFGLFENWKSKRINRAG